MLDNTVTKTANWPPPKSARTSRLAKNVVCHLREKPEPSRPSRPLSTPNPSVAREFRETASMHKMPTPLHAMRRLHQQQCKSQTKSFASPESGSFKNTSLNTFHAAGATHLETSRNKCVTSHTDETENSSCISVNQQHPRQHA